MSIQVVVVTPEKTTLDQTCEFVAIPLLDGEAGVQTGHAPMIGRLQAGELRVVVDGKAARYYVEGGFVQVSNDLVSVLTGSSCPVNEIDLSAAREALAMAEALPSSTEVLCDIKNKAVHQARTKISLSSK